jgi:hypothetical protein
MREFDIDKVITPLTAHKAVIGNDYYCGDTVFTIKRSFFAKETPKKLVSICDVLETGYPFAVYGSQYVFLYPYEDADVHEIATQRELAKWIAQGNGEWAREGGKSVFTDMTYTGSDGDSPVLDDVRVRAFGENEWVLPTKKYLDEHTRW